MLSPIRDPQLEAKARALYSEELPYHNFSHILDTLSSADLILERCARENIRIDARVVYFALLFHDAGYHEDHAAKGFANKELYSVDLAQRCLREHGISASLVGKVSKAILATERNAKFVSAEHKAVRAADLSGLAAAYERFLESSLKLKQEHEYLHDEPISWPSWQSVSREVIGFYLSQEIRLTSYFHDENGESAFHKSLRENLARLLSEPSEPSIN
jgi:predicted metal-dependent HD superfamily phosphohydrolase